MAFSHTIQRQFSSGAGTVTTSKTYTAGQEVNLDEPITASSNLQLNVAIDVSALKSLFLTTDVASTVYVNDVSGGSPTKTLTLPAGEAYMWPNGSDTNPLGASDVTAIYVTSAAAGTLQMRALVDPTP